MTHVAVDLLGEGVQPASVLDALPAALDADPELVVTLVVPPDSTTADLAGRGIVTGDRVHLVTARRGIPAGPEAIRDVRARRDSGVRVAARLVRDGKADAMVSVAPLEAVAAAAQFTFGLLPGATRGSLAAVVDTGGEATPGGVVLCDAGASVDVTSDDLAQFALAGAAYARVRAGAGQPRVALLAARPALPDTVRRAAHELLGSLGVDYVGQVDAGVLVAGGHGQRPDVVVTDGFTGDVVLACLRAVRAAVPGARPQMPEGLDPAWRSPAGPDLQGGTIVLAVDGVAVRAGDPVGGPDDLSTGIPAALATAATVWRGGLVDQIRAELARLVARRRSLAGLSP
ncbi:phosphate starvation-inducible protein PhoH [Frankia sp. CNm7]|uniref:phosphate acyltransferase n=1 Tax=Frankia nepalensis TaxID=1836974 RepID=A0A937UUP0_9ACTN|nr:phosphate starvation-inducible protein PhoH [Frankia nepalensis]MBL7497015.1 phosphate starvation-inducible protein PhoH [Frankia nepalensis]MBL7510517.1 phosphate starvation-inducible protein PhoH [Frankia nepalensis]MBL7520986.1 phosphate starvation-inducible protein PhoH [Frankia nepalensis]MBL7632445.1 phosphate starvation-inducible protein PhoH [Frankia nepalensis]